jgi:geranylgeranyl diphosphate synthase, type I
MRDGRTSGRVIKVDDAQVCSAGTLGGPAVEELRHGREMLTPALRRVAESFHPGIRAIVDHHFGWPDETGGKCLRGTLALVAARAYGPERDALPAAVAVELLHNFSLVHDDIMDNDRTRRNRQTAWVRFGVGSAILAGDALFAAAYHQLAGAPTAAAQRRLAGTALALLTGQASDLAFQAVPMVTVAQYEAMAAGKTAALISCATALGAELLGAPSLVLQSLAAAGHHLGLAFQAVDDVLGIWGDSTRTGKTTRADLREGKLTLPVVLAHQQAGAQQARLGAYLRAARNDEDATRAAAELIDRLGGRELTLRYARGHAAAARTKIDDSSLPDTVRHSLADLVQITVDRER